MNRLAIKPLAISNQMVESSSLEHDSNENRFNHFCTISHIAPILTKKKEEETCIIHKELHLYA